MLTGPVPQMSHPVDNSAYSLSFFPPPDTYPGALTINITLDPPAGTVHYTTNGSAPTCASTTTLPFTISESTLIQAIACDEENLPLTYPVAGNYILDGIYYVSAQRGSDETGYGNKISPYKTLGKAAGLALSGQHIRVAEGLYPESLSIVSKNLNLYGGYDSTFSHRDTFSHPTTINPGNTGPFAISISDSSTVLIEGFILYGGSGVAESSGINIVSGSLGILQHNVISGGFGTNLSIAVNQSNAGTSSLVKNNFILGGAGAVSKGFYLYFSTDRIYNNTIFAGSGASAYGIDVGFKARPQIANNIIFGMGGLGYGIFETDSGNNDGSPSLFQNNVIHGFASGLYYDDEGSGALTLASELNDYSKTTGNSAYPASGNESVVLVGDWAANISVFVNLKGVDANVGLWDPSSQNMSLQPTSACVLKQGGLDGAGAGWVMTQDFYRNPRTAVLSCSPSNAGAAGWSLGAVEQNG